MAKEAEYTTYASWEKAVKKKFPSCHIVRHSNGKRVDAFPDKKGRPDKTKTVGGWSDGVEFGTVYPKPDKYHEPFNVSSFFNKDEESVKTTTETKAPAKYKGAERAAWNYGHGDALEGEPKRKAREDLDMSRAEADAYDAGYEQGKKDGGKRESAPPRLVGVLVNGKVVRVNDEIEK